MTVSHYIHLEKEESPALRKLLDIRTVQLLLIGMYHVLASILGRCMTRQERQTHRESAWRILGAVKKFHHNEQLKVKFKDGIARWSGDHAVIGTSVCGRSGFTQGPIIPRNTGALRDMYGHS